MYPPSLARSEIVLWHVFTTPRTITTDQLNVFADVTLDAHDEGNVDNNRVIQALSGREVYSYEASLTSSAAKACVSVLAVILSFAAFMLSA